MGAKYNYGTVGATGGGFSTYQAWIPPSLSEDLNHERWQWQSRSPRTFRYRNAWRSGWSFGFTSSCGTDLDCGAPADRANPYEPFSAYGSGNSSLKFLKGICRDASNNPLSGAIVQAFRTSDDAFAGYEVQSRGDGSYDLGTNFPGVAHYCVAYLAGSPDITGTTVNTLIPTNIDGS